MPGFQVASSSSSIDENEARVYTKISERFKSMSIKGLKNINLASSANISTTGYPP